MKAKERALALIEQIEAHNRALTAGLNRNHSRDDLVIITERIHNTVLELQDLVEVEDDPFQTGPGFFE